MRRIPTILAALALAAACTADTDPPDADGESPACDAQFPLRFPRLG